MFMNDSDPVWNCTKTKSSIAWRWQS